MSGLEFLESRHAARILIALLEREERGLRTNVLELQKHLGLGSRHALTSTLRVLEEAGLIVTKKARGVPPERTIALTEKGRMIAQKLVEIKAILALA